MKPIIQTLFLFILSFMMAFPNLAYAMEEDEAISLHSEAAILIDAATGAVLFDKESDRLMYPASITKIVTGILAIEDGNLDDIVTVSEKARNIDGTRVYLLEGEQVPLLKLVQGLLINSGNDAATAIAEHMDGSEAQFAERMNRFVRETIGVKNTTFQNPHGLFDENHQTTAYDMAKITQYAMKNSLFRSIVGTKEMEWIGEGWETTLYNHNKLLWRYEGTTGVKNGFVNESGNTLVASVQRGESEWIAVTLKADSAESAYSDMETLFDYGFAQFETRQVSLPPALLEAYQDRFVIPQQLTFTSRKDENFVIQINESSGQLVVSSLDGTTLYSEELETREGAHVQSMKPIKSPDNSEGTSMEKKATSFKLSASTTFVLTILITFAFLIIRKRMKRKNAL
ncbi:D-alanyl-D-alanine carboxypeptidase family protein [Paenibacillus sp. J2TS4]|uniref:D-alanyl-D-alanine carboxypeptidase family protein n=1 Tax=Paenibacillus sp. J2TS4 TaxID=2807194 RepID=UPI001B15C643|nr:D-alanyl-D-alanine carboxypeptidase family protein [Paenibacillus sp. J2TS4]GIP31906.1 hypothetical protein J2TS4_11160 [Paenibacillus sp. J2TS4]